MNTECAQNCAFLKTHSKFSAQTYQQFVNCISETKSVKTNLFRRKSKEAEKFHETGLHTISFLLRSMEFQLKTFKNLLRVKRQVGYMIFHLKVIFLFSTLGH